MATAKGELSVLGGEAGHKWKNLFCQLHHGKLQFFESEKDSLRFQAEPLFQIKVSGSRYGKTTVIPKENKDFCFSFRIPYAIYLSASSESELQKWMDVIQNEGTAEFIDNITNVPTPHYFKKTSFNHPVWCHHCFKFVWGIAYQGFECSSCSYICHEKCKDSVGNDCSPTLKQPVTEEQKKSVKENNNV